MESRLLPLGYALPAFALRDVVSSEVVYSERYLGAPLLVALICNHCPYVTRIKEGLVTLARKLEQKGISTVAISSNDPTLSPIDSPEKMALDAQIYSYPFPYLFDEDQSFARDVQAICTPEFYLFNKRARLVYRGQMDRARPNNDEPNDGHELLAAASAMLAGAPPVDLQRPSMGCSIKWRQVGRTGTQG